MTQILKWPVKVHTLNLCCDTGLLSALSRAGKAETIRPRKHSFCERVSTLKLVYLLQHNFQFWGCFLHMRGEDGQAVPEVRHEEQHRMRRMNRVRTASACVIHKTPLTQHTYLSGSMLSMAARMASQIRSTLLPSRPLDCGTVSGTGGGYMVVVTSSSLRTSVY